MAPPDPSSRLSVLHDTVRETQHCRGHTLPVEDKTCSINAKTKEWQPLQPRVGDEPHLSRTTLEKERLNA